MKQIVGQLAALMLITVLVTSVAATPAFADWDKTKRGYKKSGKKFLNKIQKSTQTFFKIFVVGCC